MKDKHTFSEALREKIDYMALRQRKLESFQCLRLHCYPVTEDMVMRESAFNLKRANLCAKECLKPMDSLTTRFLLGQTAVTALQQNLEEGKINEEEYKDGVLDEIVTFNC